MSLPDLAPVSASTSNTIRRSVTLSGAAKVMPRWRHSSTSYFGASNSYLTNSSMEEPEKSEIGNTDLKTACSPSSARPPSGSFTIRNWSYEAFWTSMRFGISATSGMFPKNFLTRLRPLNERVWAIVAPWLALLGARPRLARALQNFPGPRLATRQNGEKPVSGKPLFAALRKEVPHDCPHYAGVPAWPPRRPGAAD